MRDKRAEAHQQRSSESCQCQGVEITQFEKSQVLVVSAERLLCDKHTRLRQRRINSIRFGEGPHYREGETIFSYAIKAG